MKGILQFTVLQDGLDWVRNTAQGDVVIVCRGTYIVNGNGRIQIYEEEYGVPHRRYQAETPGLCCPTRIIRRCACGEPTRINGHDCLACHAASNRRWRREHRPSLLTRYKDRLRQRARARYRRGKITKEACRVCGGAHELEFHHPDYFREPDSVEVACRKHHLYEHHGDRLVAYFV